MNEHTAERDAGRSANGRPLDSHDRHLDNTFVRELHAEHVRLYGAQCATCGCCWCCDEDCCAEYTCPNPDCGCNAKEQVDMTTALGGGSA